MNRRVITLGEALGVLRTSSPGSLAMIDRLEVGTGGAEANVAVGLARLGASVTWIGRVGDDGLGRRIVRELRAEGVEVAAAVDDRAPTGLLIKETPVPGRTTVTYHRSGSAGSRLSPVDLEAIEITSGDLVHVTGITPALSASSAAAVDALLDRAEAAGAAISFDVNHRSALWSAADAADAYRRIAGRATLVFAGDDEARLLTPQVGSGASAEQLARALAELGPSEAVVKLGARGALAIVDGDVVERNAVPVDAVDTVGAGDAFVAGYLAERMAGRDAGTRLDTAVRTGAFACLHPGDWEGAARREDLGLLDAGTGDPVSR